ncbi:baseplate J/gp47 family protein [Brevibacillus humidisoli]|uniref:baseplate J/gp47 family protein n=1 Tax=Brevibacillus humidisoli TaxID=2895522 RepID=UPI001E61BFE0|nr:baseplate J/gp47 family protein [Brevibacillus humidisoli]UFJ40096.1 baseplate J/gp47 family protein [Brevibacillus humidisoli]
MEPYDLEYPLAEEISEQQQLREYHFLQGFLSWADGEFLDAHGVLLGLKRNEGENDESYRDRLIAKAVEEEGSGAEYDYTRWTKEVANVGEVFVWGEPPNTVRIAITDATGAPASADLVTAVQEHVNRPDKHHMNDQVIVSAATAINLSITGQVELAAGTTLDQVAPQIEAGIREYIRTQRERVLYSEVHRLFKVQGVVDYRNVLINGSTDNVTIPFGSIPVAASVEVTLL